jgi:protein-tyrosine phosphatase
MQNNAHTDTSFIASLTDVRFSVLFLCMGNICRSPTAHGVFRHKVHMSGLAQQVQVSSAGTHNYHPGEPPDRRQLTAQDFEQHDLLLAMDWDNLALAEQRCPPAHRRKLRRLTEFCRRHDAAVVPDPYYGGESGFQQVLDLIEDACDGLLDQVSCQLIVPTAVTKGERE